MAAYPRVLSRTLDVLFYGLLALVICAALLAIGLTIWTDVDTNLAVPISFVPDAGSVSVHNSTYGDGTIVNAQGMAQFDEVGSPLHVAQAIALIAAFLIPAFVILHMLRRLVQSVAQGDPFVMANVNRIRIIGLFTVAFEILAALANFWLQSSIAATTTAQGIELGANFTLNPAVLLIGMVIVALAEVFRYGAGLQRDADLTV